MESITTYKAAVTVDGQPKIIDVEKRELNEGEVFIKVEASPINPSDRYTTRGDYGIIEKQSHPSEGKGIGFEASGLVIDAHETVKELIGKKVAFSQDIHSPTYTGVWRQYTYAIGKSVIPFPDEMDYETICCNFINPLTVCGFIDTFKKNGHKAIVHTPASSALGKMLVRYCKANDIPLINIVRREEQVKILEEIGAENIFVSTSETFVEDLKAKAAELEATICFDAVGGGKATANVIDALPFKSTHYIYGSLSNEDLVYRGRKMMFEEKAINSFWLGPWLRSITPEETRGWIGTVFQDLIQPKDKSIFKTSVAKTFPLAKIEDALKVSEELASEGKVLIKPHQE